MDISSIWWKLFKQISVSFVTICSACIILFAIIITVLFWLHIIEKLYTQIMQIVFASKNP